MSVKYNTTALKSMTRRFNFVFMSIILSLFIFTRQSTRFSLSCRADQLEFGGFVYNVLDIDGTSGHAAPSARTVSATQTTLYCVKLPFIYILENVH